MSSVFLCKEKATEKIFAVKKFEKYGNHDFITSGLHEAIILKGISHPLIPKYKDICIDRTNFYIVMEYIDGITLSRLLIKFGTLSEKRALYLTGEICKAIIYIHGLKNPVFHRDIKPGNVMIGWDGRVFLLDFGISGGLQDFQNKKSFGTKGYTSPEVLNKKSLGNEKSDIYSLGATLYTMITGRDAMRGIVFKGGNCSKISPKTQRIIKIATHKNPKKRFKSAEEMLKSIIS